MSVTKQQQLKYLAEGGSVWPYPVPVIMMSCNNLGESIDRQPAGQGAGYCHYISFTEWREERDKIETKAKDNILRYEQDMYPPTGTECEFRYKYSDKGHFADWNQGTIRYIGNDLFVVEVNGREMVYNDMSTYVFRPIGDDIGKIEEVDGSWYTRGEKPPTGCICEIKHSCWSERYQTKIVAVTKEYVIVEDNGIEQHFHLDDITFYPLQTKRDKAIEDMLIVLSDLEDYSLKSIVSALYDVGYDKPYTQGIRE